MSPSAGDPPLVVIGGGITGLVAARTIAAARSGVRIVLLEAGGRLGGRIQTHPFGGGLLEGGPDWFLTRRDEAVSLVEDLGLTDDLVRPAVAGARVWIGERLHALPEGAVRGIPTSLRSLQRSGIVSVRGVVRAAADRFLPGPLTGPDVSVGAYVSRRFGREVLEKLVDPMIAASRSGTVSRISLAMSAPEIDTAARAERSLMKALARTAAGDGRPPFAGIRGGMERLVQALVRELEGVVEVRTETPASSIARTPEGYAIHLAGGEQLRAAGMVVAAPPFVAAKLLGELAPDAAADLASIPFAPAALLGFIYPDAPPPPPGVSGFLVPTQEGRLLTAAAWFSVKWPHARPKEGVIVRAFAGRSAGDPVMEMDDHDLARRAEGEIARAMGIPNPPSERKVLRWERALPQFEVGHASVIDRIDAHMSSHPLITLAGAGYRGSGIPDCIAQGWEAAARLVAAHAARPRR